jgi:arabinan endo-1,5-alpha-L-arabinosidase
MPTNVPADWSAALEPRRASSSGWYILLAATVLACGGGSSATSVDPPVVPVTPVGPSATEYVNPVLNADFPDPGIVHASDGNYYAYATQTTGLRIQVARSRDLVSWTPLGEALPTRPSWATQSQNFWAPDVSEHGGVFVMYFSAQIDASQRTSPSDGFCIGMATASSPAGPFVDVGHPVRCGSGFTTIDPMAFDDPQTGKQLLYWGSSGSPIAVQELGPDRATFAAGSAPLLVLSPRSGSDPAAYDTGLIEGPWVTYRAPYYYLFFSGNNCCGSAAHYAVMVARSAAATGPFEVLTAPGSAAALPVLRAGDAWTAPGHNSIVRDAAGTDWMLYHAIDPAQPYLIPGNTSISRRPMLLDRVTYANGWPSVGPSGTPTSTPQARPVP